MIKILSHDAINVSYEEANELLYVVWTEESEQISDDFFKQVNLLYVQESSNRLVSSILLDTTHFLYAISMEMQAWVNAEIIPQILQNGVKRIAFLMSSALISQLSIEQTMEELEDKIVGYFDDEVKARAWLLRV